MLPLHAADAHETVTVTEFLPALNLPTLSTAGCRCSGLGVLVGTTAPTCRSNAPMSAAAPDGRANPRWSVVDDVLPESIAGLPASSPSVLVGPPFSASAPSRGSRARMLWPLSAKAELGAFWIRL